MPSKERIVVAMSGGVDSSVAAGLLAEQGYDLVGVTFHLWDAPAGQMVGRCCAPEDRDEARRSCELFSFPHYVIDERKAFSEQVVEPFVQEYAMGNTPVPCVHCNQQLKLGRLQEIARRLGATKIATGHYARTTCGDPPSLMRGVDRNKDQSYFLYGIDQNLLPLLLFPLGSMTKPEVRTHAQRFGLSNAGKPDSQSLCFIPDGNTAGFLEKRIVEQRPGAMIDEKSQTELRMHDGIHRFTVGQRKGLGLSGGAAKYVLNILPETNEVLVGDEKALYQSTMEVHQTRWLQPREGTFRGEVKIRYRHEPAPAIIRCTTKGFSVTFDEAQRAISPGQAAVLYDQETVLGGGIIVRHDSEVQQDAVPSKHTAAESAGP